MATVQKERETSRESKKHRLRRERLEREAAARHQAQRARRVRLGIAAAAAVGALALGGIFFASNSGQSAGGGSTEASAGDREQFPYAVGEPGPGDQAPAISLLPSTDGGTFDLAAQRGKRTLLYFQEGIMCQPCWDQLKDLEAQRSKLAPLGIDQLVSITHDPLPNLRAKVAEEGLTTPVLSDPNLEVSTAYTTNQYGMMGQSANGHSFVIVGPDGKIERRLDYGGAPDYSMYVPLAPLLADLRGGDAGGRG